MDDEGNPVGQAFLIAKPFELRQTTYNGLTVDAITYLYSDSVSRLADGFVDENQIVIPPYLVNFSIVMYCSFVEGILDTVGTDVNAAGRAWAKEAP
jgi:hypothetical protein